MATLQSNERGGCLTAWLALMLIANAATAFYYITSGSALQQAFPSTPSWMFLILAALGIVNLISVFGLWTWKRWGFYLFIATSLVALVINLSLGLSILSSLVGLIGVAILWFLLRDKWQSYT